MIRDGAIESSVVKDLPRGASEDVLGIVKKFLEAQSIALTSIGGIIVTLGPGPFTALRIGVVIANTLAWALHIPLFGYKVHEFKKIDDLAQKAWQQFLQPSSLHSQKLQKFQALLPWYGKEPNITKPK